MLHQRGCLLNLTACWVFEADIFQKEIASINFSECRHREAIWLIETLLPGECFVDGSIDDTRPLPKRKDMLKDIQILIKVEVDTIKDQKPLLS